MKIKDILLNTKFEKAPKGFLPYIEIGDIDINNKTYTLKDKGAVAGAVKVPKGVILVSTVRPNRGAITIVKDENVSVSSAFAILEIDESICLKEYLFFLLNSPIFLGYLLKNATGATYPTCSKEDIYSYDINVPSIKEQERIMKELGNVTEIIKINKEKLSYYDELVKARFVELFGDMAHSSNKVCLEEISDFVTVGIANSATHAYADSGVVMLRNQNIKENYLDENDLIYITPDFAKKYGSKQLTENDILVIRTGYPGVACLVPKKYEGCQTFTTLIVRLKDSTFAHANYVCHYINSSFGKDYVEQSKVGVAQQNFGAKALAKMPIAIPTMDLQEQFAAFVKQTDKSKSVCEEKIKKYTELYDKLMNDYFGG